MYFVYDIIINKKMHKGRTWGRVDLVRVGIGYELTGYLNYHGLLLAHACVAYAHTLHLYVFMFFFNKQQNLPKTYYKRCC